MEIFSLTVGAVLMAITLYLAFGWRREGEWLRWWYNRMSKPDGGPWWMRGHFKPNKTQAAVVAWMFVLAGASLATVFIAMGLGA